MSVEGPRWRPRSAASGLTEHEPTGEGAETVKSAGTIEVHVIAHTHWDREWYLTREQYRARLVDLIDRVLDRMAAEPAFAFFHLDGQTIVLEDYLEVRPEREGELRALVRDGRLLVGPWYVMPDMFLVSGEALVRNLALGLRVAEDFGAAMRVGYMPDPFGHVAQMPQVLAGFGLDGAILWRGFGGTEAEYAWEAPDGTRALLLHLPREGYCNGLRLPLLPPDRLGTEARAIVDREAARSTCGQVLLMVGVDHVEPHPALLRVVEVLNGTPGVRARLSTLPAYVAAVRAAGAVEGHRLEVVRGELRGGQDYAHLLPGVLSARTYLKQANARVQRELEWWAEPLSVFAFLAGAPADRGLLRYAWKTLLQNHPHDSICGCSIDEVHEENVARFARARQAAEIASARGARALAGRLPPAPPGAIRAVAVNTDIRPWSGVLEATIDVPLEPAGPGDQPEPALFDEPLDWFGPDARVQAVTGPGGEPLAFQVLDEADVVVQRMSRYLPPVTVRTRRTKLAIEAGEIPPSGYAAVDVHVGTAAPVESAGPSPSGSVVAAGQILENDLLRVEVREDGTVDVTDKRSGAVYRRAFALEDGGDVGDEYNYAPPAADRRVTSDEARDVRVRAVERGPLRAALRMELALPVPRSAAADRRGRMANLVELAVVLDLRLRAGSPVVEAVVCVDNRARDHRLRLLLPTGAAAAASHRADTAFALVERTATEPPSGPLVEAPVGTAPMQSFVDAGDGAVGAVVITDGLPEYEVVSGEAGAVIAVTLVRAVGALSRGDLSTRRGHAGPGLATPGAQCPGTHEFRVAFMPRSAPPPPRALYAAARAVLAPPRVFAPGGGTGDLPASASFLRVAAGPEADAIASACKLAETGDEVVLRLFNAGDRPAAIAIESSLPILAACRADLAEHRREPCAAPDGRVEIVLGPHRIETLRLEIGSRRP
jgi:mannosylglycerate hydrolase